MLKIEKREQNDVLVFKLDGQLDGGPASQKLQEMLKEALSEGKKFSVLDMKGVSWINSLGAGVLIATYASVKREDGLIAMVGISDRARVVLKTCGLIPAVFEEYDSVEEAIEEIKN
ncbi:MAG: anti-sigma factor antagonist [Candidatus Latescibacteria bacterium]|nr:anti-sigma factor antagonist [bacterium]MBD3424673.1 anti-sigma factor antagonist [Candidatus Latescibacterota bacterium]